MQTGQVFWQSFIITRQSTESRRPAETSFDHPSTRRQHKASFRRWEFHDFELDPRIFHGISCVYACVALINIGDLDCFSGLRLRPLGKFGDLGSILFIGRGHTQSDYDVSGVNRCMNFIAFAAFRPVVTDADSAVADTGASGATMNQYELSIASR